MTNWTPDLSGRNGPRYRAIADALAEDVRGGRLAAGTRLPTHRDLAWRLKMTIGTVSRAYAEAERRGLVAGEVGRGTYVRRLAGIAPIMPGDTPGESLRQAQLVLLRRGVPFRDWASLRLIGGGL